MSIFSALFEQGKVYNFEQAFGVKDITSTAMQAAIKDWAQLYYQTEPTQDEDPCQRIPVSVVAKLTKTTFSEYKAVPTKQGAEYIDTLLRELDAVKVKAMQQALIGGQCYLKPVFGRMGVSFAVVSRGSYIPLGATSAMRLQISAWRSARWRAGSTTRCLNGAVWIQKAI